MRKISHEVRESPGLHCTFDKDCLGWLMVVSISSFVVYTHIKIRAQHHLQTLI